MLKVVAHCFSNASMSCKHWIGFVVGRAVGQNGQQSEMMRHVEQKGVERQLS